jgi:hypothetical protein
VSTFIEEWFDNSFNIFSEALCLRGRRYKTFFFLTITLAAFIDKRSDCAALDFQARIFAGESSKVVHARNRSSFSIEAFGNKKAGGTKTFSPLLLSRNHQRKGFRGKAKKDQLVILKAAKAA